MWQSWTVSSEGCSGDAGFTDLGLWRAIAAEADTWNKLSLYGEAEGGNTLYGINIIPLRWRVNRWCSRTTAPG